jgi:superoxide dismutase, Fe-Mn family
MPYSLPKLGFELHELEPVISKELLEIHYSKHHAAYVNNLNKAVNELSAALSAQDLKKSIDLQSSIVFNGGGHFNHTFFWETLAPMAKGGGELSSGPLLEKILKNFGSLDTCKEKLSAAAVSVQGSGWGWLVFCPVTKELYVTSTQNHALPRDGIPLLCIDVWEHAYYLQYKNVRADFVKNIWSIINWKTVETRFLNCIK